MKCVSVLEIIAEELQMPTDASLNEILAALFCIDEDNKIRNLLAYAGTQDLLEMFRKDGLI
jgi:hypothetical protein